MIRWTWKKWTGKDWMLQKDVYKHAYIKGYFIYTIEMYLATPFYQYESWAWNNRRSCAKRVQGLQLPPQAMESSTRKPWLAQVSAKIIPNVLPCFLSVDSEADWPGHHHPCQAASGSLSPCNSEWCYTHLRESTVLKARGRDTNLLLEINYSWWPP